MWLPCLTIDPLDLSMSNHKSTPMICIACSTPSTAYCLLIIISSNAVGIKPLLVPRSTTQKSGGNMSTNDQTHPINRLIRWFQNGAHVKLQTALRTPSQLVRRFRMTLLLTVLRLRVLDSTSDCTPAQGAGQYFWLYSCTGCWTVLLTVLLHRVLNSTSDCTPAQGAGQYFWLYSGTGCLTKAWTGHDNRN